MITDRTPSSGPLWSLTPSPGSASRLWPLDISQPLQYSLSLTQSSTGESLAATGLTKSYLTPSVERIEVRERGLVASLFLPSPSLTCPSPGVITVYGGVNRGRVPEDRAAMLASKGFVTLALAWYGVEAQTRVNIDSSHTS